MQHSRTHNSIVNSIVGIATAMVNIFLNFAVRVIIVRFLGDEINGIHSLFQSIMSVLTVMETSLTTSMIIHLYKPLKDKHDSTICKLMAIYKKLYRLLAVVFLGIAIVINFMLNNIASTEDSYWLHMYFAIFSVSFVANYLTYSHRCILYGEQNNRFSVAATTLSEVIFRGMGLAIIVIKQEYWPFLVCLIFEKLLGNFICKRRVLQHHAYLKRKDKGEQIDAKLKNEVLASAKPLLINQLAITFQNASPSIIISAVIKNISLVGYYGNYQLVIGAMNMLFSQFGAAFTSSFGNLATSQNTEHMKIVQKRVHFIISSIATVCCCGFLACIKDFIMMAFGVNHVLPTLTGVLLTISMFINLSNVTVISIQNATGTHRIDSKNMIAQSLLTMLLSLAGGMIWGLNGIVMGLILPTLIFTTIIKGRLIAINYLNYNTREFAVLLLMTFLKFGMVLMITTSACSVITIDYLFMSFVIKGIVAVIISVVLIMLLSFRSEECSYVINIVKKYIN